MVKPGYTVILLVVLVVTLAYWQWQQNMLLTLQALHPSPAFMERAAQQKLMSFLSFVGTMCTSASVLFLITSARERRARLRERERLFE